ncbi:MAG: bifunctional 4-hydroxy-2-oxoglutarate aldolase/2-dehydro-3-deoxy-phosphogluconate aldolase [Sterolibacterium sp.]|jgi:2-dehydro-3-deoxyphosphogluconate aldolase/(4S)-4-hydroxy-2-oxoglutarate aldolase
MQLSEILRASPVMPVIVINNLAHAVPLVRALVEGGIRLIEITLRTPQALEAVRAVRREVPDALTGVGTITRVEDFDAAFEAGALFGVSPGATPELLAAAARSGLPFLPGVMTPSDVMNARQAGFSALKLFPARQAGGVEMLKALAGPFPDLIFCPTGGISAATAAEFLALDNVACVGGSWLAPQALVEKGDWTGIRDIARQAAALQLC